MDNHGNQVMVFKMEVNTNDGELITGTEVLREINSSYIGKESYITSISNEIDSNDRVHIIYFRP